MLIPQHFQAKTAQNIWQSNSSNLIFCTYKVKTEKGRSRSGLFHFPGAGCASSAPSSASDNPNGPPLISRSLDLITHGPALVMRDRHLNARNAVNDGGQALRSLIPAAA